MSTKLFEGLTFINIELGLNAINGYPISANMKSAQLAQNKMLRMLDRVSLKDHVTKKSLLDNM